MERESDIEDFSVSINPSKGHVTLSWPGSFIQFEDLTGYREFIQMLQSSVLGLEQYQARSEPSIDGNYAEEVLEQWQAQIEDQA